MMRCARSFGFLLLLFCGLAQAGEAILPAKEADIRKLVEVSGTLKVVTLMTQSAVDQMIESLRASRSDLPAGLLDSLKSDVMGIFSERISEKGGLLDMILPLYNREFTHEEIKGLLAFYQSPLGQKVILSLPIITQESMKVGQKWSEALEPPIQKAVLQRIRKASAR
jgi:uncharacterized protein